MRSPKLHWRFFVSIFILTTLAGAQTTAPFLSKDEILERCITALGGRERLSAVASAHTKSSLSMGGLKGTYEQWDSDRGQYRDSANVPGVFQQDQVFDGNKGWVRDLSGTVHELSGSDLEDVVTNAYQATFSWLLPDRLPGRLDFTGEDSSHAHYVFNIAPEHGKPYTIFLDKQTLLPAREEQRENDKIQVQYFSDWRDVQGVKFPGHIRQSTGDPKYDVLFSLEQVEINPTLNARFFEMPADNSAKARFTLGKDFVEFPVKLYAV